MKVISPIVKTFALSAVITFACTKHWRVFADENPAGGGFGGDRRRGGAEDRLAVSQNVRLFVLTAELCCSCWFDDLRVPCSLPSGRLCRD